MLTLINCLLSRFFEARDDMHLVALCDARITDNEGFITHEELLASLDEKI